MDYTLTIKLPTREQAQLWIEETFDLSMVNIKGIWQSPFRGEQLCLLAVTVPEETKKAFQNGLDRLRSVYPEEKRIMVYWEESN